MSRDFYESVLGNPDADAYEGDAQRHVFTALEGIRVSVFNRGTTDLVTVYQRETGIAQGPSPEAGTTGGPNPFFTGPTASVQFWCDAPVRYDIQISDTITPPRIGTRIIPWNAIALDGVPEASLGADVLAAFLPIGGQIPYAGDGDPPGGRFLIADGRFVLISDWPTAFARWGHKYNRDASGNMVDPGGGRFKIPDKRGRGSLGADNMGTAQGSAGRLPSLLAVQRVPGTGGGSDTHSHTANIPSHTHSASLPNHVHTSPDHYHLAAGLYTGNHGHGGITGAGIGATVGVQSLAGGPLLLTRGAGAGGEHQHGINADGNIGVYGNVGWASTAMGAQNTGNPTALPTITTGDASLLSMVTDVASTLQNYEIDNWIVRMK